jgi:hypothetical protein
MTVSQSVSQSVINRDTDYFEVQLSSVLGIIIYYYNCKYYRLFFKNVKYQEIYFINRLLTIFTERFRQRREEISKN